MFPMAAILLVSTKRMQQVQLNKGNNAGTLEIRLRSVVQFSVPFSFQYETYRTKLVSKLYNKIDKSQLVEYRRSLELFFSASVSKLHPPYTRTPKKTTEQEIHGQLPSLRSPVYLLLILQGAVFVFCTFQNSVSFFHHDWRPLSETIEAIRK